MSKELAGILVLNQISLDGGTTWKTIVCEDTSTINGSSASTEKKTKCSNFSTTSNNATVVSGSGVANGNPVTGEMSYIKMQQLRDALTTVTFRRQNSASQDGTILTGVLTYAKFNAKITEVTETSNVDDLVQFTWSVTSTGDVDWTVGS